MKILVVFDEKGKIIGTVIPKHDQIKIRSAEGTAVHVIEKPELDTEAARKYLQDLHQNFRMEVSGEPRLVPKKASKLK
jgi:hypothetical protein